MLWASLVWWAANQDCKQPAQAKRSQNEAQCEYEMSNTDHLSQILLVVHMHQDPEHLGVDHSDQHDDLKDSLSGHQIQ
jgi:hypothetical protein